MADLSGSDVTPFVLIGCLLTLFVMLYNIKLESIIAAVFLDTTVIMRTCLLIGLGLTVATIISNIVAVALPYWLYGAGNVKRYEGLWVECQRSDTHTDCEYKFLPPEFIDAVRVMMLFGLVFCIISLICGFMYACIKKNKTSLGTAGGVLVFLAGIFCLIAVITYVSKYTLLTWRNNMQLSSGFGVAVVTTVLAFISAISYCVSHIREEYDD